MTNSSGYITFEEAMDTPFVAGQFWELHPDDIITGVEYNDEGNIVADVELTSLAAITDIETTDEGNYILWGEQLGERCRIEAGIDFDTRMRLIDAR